MTDKPMLLRLQEKLIVRFVGSAMPPCHRPASSSSAPRCDRFAELQPRALFAAALTAACRHLHRSRYSSSSSNMRARWAGRRVCTFVTHACAGRSSRRPSVATSSASPPGHRSTPLVPALRVHARSSISECASTTCADPDAALLDGEVRVLCHVVHERVTAERTSPGRAQPTGKRVDSRVGQPPG